MFPAKANGPQPKCEKFSVSERQSRPLAGRRLKKASIWRFFAFAPDKSRAIFALIDEV
jgi:hypothetical protein